jgi:hypothetical protein
MTKSTNWRWITTKENVADDTTRDSNDMNFGFNSRWFQKVPQFLKTRETTWSYQPFLGAGIDPAERTDEQYLQGAEIDLASRMIVSNRVVGAGTDLNEEKEANVQTNYRVYSEMLLQNLTVQTPKIMLKLKFNTGRGYNDNDASRKR